MGDCVYFYAMDLASGLNLKGSSSRKVEKVKLLVGRFIAFQVSYNDRGAKAQAPFTLLPADEDAGTQLDRAGLQRQHEGRAAPEGGVLVASSAAATTTMDEVDNAGATDRPRRLAQTAPPK